MSLTNASVGLQRTVSLALLVISSLLLFQYLHEIMWVFVCFFFRVLDPE